MIDNRTAKRTEFLSDLLTTAIECDGYGFFSVREYAHATPATTHAVICENETDDFYEITLDTMARGLGVIRSAIMHGTDDYLVNAATGERLYFGGDARSELLLADRTNGEDGDYDVVGALAVLECALFGHVVYA